MSIKIMLYGDSLMAGYGLTQNENLSSVLMKKIKEDNMDIDLITLVYQAIHPKMV